MNIDIREMIIEDYPQAYELWRSIEGMKLETADSKDGVEKYLLRNPGMSYVAICNDRVIGTILCGEDGRRGYMQHLCVKKEFRGRGIGGDLIERSLSAFKNAGLHEVRIFIFKSNVLGNKYWDKKGWITRDDIHVKAIDLE